MRTHPETHRKALFLGRRPFSYIPGLSVKDSEALLDEIWAHTVNPEFTWTQEWQVGDMIVWDNRCTMHRATPFNEMNVRRVLHRTTVSDGVNTVERRHAERHSAA